MIDPLQGRSGGLTITVLAGGPGVEREVSLHSGQAVCEALVSLGHDAVVCDISPDDLSPLQRRADFVFIALHGEFGEDGTVQQRLESMRLPYSGSGPRASRRAMDKVDSKRCFQQVGITTPDYMVVTRDHVGERVRTFGTPAVAKPVASGSSVDITVARTEEQLCDAVADVVEKYGRALLERYIEGPELTVGIVGEQALPVCEIRTPREFYDYHAKYLDDQTQYLFDLNLPKSLLASVQELSLKAHEALGCRVFSRVDWMVDGRSLEPHVLEVNTIPGFTAHSLLPKAAAKAGFSFEALCQRIVDLSMVEHAEGRSTAAATVRNRGC